MNVVIKNNYLIYEIKLLNVIEINDSKASNIYIDRQFSNSLHITWMEIRAYSVAYRG